MDNQTLIPLAILLVLTSTWTVFHYAKRKTSCLIILLSIIAFGLGSAAVALMPIDLSYASDALNQASSTSSSNANIDNGEEGEEGNANDNDANNRDITEPTTSTANDDDDPANNNPTYLPWQITYWTTMFLAWIILPITREILKSGQFTFRTRFKEGCSRSFRSIFLMFIAGIVAIIAMAIHMKSVHIVTVVLPVLMALGNTYGLLLVSLLLGNGLVNVPRKLWREACPANELRRARIMACGAEEELFEAVMGLEDVEDKIEEVCQTAVNLNADERSGIMQNEEGDITLGDDDDDDDDTAPRRRRATRCGLCCRVDNGVTEFHECLEELVRRKNETVNLCAERRTRRRGTGGSAAAASPSRSTTRRQNSSDDEMNDNEINTMDIKYLVSLSGQLKTAQERVTSAQLRWEYLVRHNMYFSALMEDGGNDVDGSSDEVDGSTDTNLLSANDNSSTPKCWHKVRHALHRCWVRCLRLPTYRAISIITAFLSVFVLMSEVTLAAPLNLSPFSWTLHALELTTTGYILYQLAALIPLLYMSLCVYTCLFQMSTLGPYCMRGNRQSNGVALVFNAQYLVRLQFALGYNYLLM